MLTVQKKRVAHQGKASLEIQPHRFPTVKTFITTNQKVSLWYINIDKWEILLEIIKKNSS